MLVDFVRVNRLAYNHASHCLCALTEFVQGPCPENQVSIERAKFYKIANNVINWQFQTKEIYEKDMEENYGKPTLLHNNFQVSKMKNAVLILLMSMMEQRNPTDPLVVKMRQNIKYEILRDNLIRTYFLYIKEKNEYTEEILFRVNIYHILSQYIIFSILNGKKKMMPLKISFLIWVLIFYFYSRNGMRELLPVKVLSIYIYIYIIHSYLS